MILCSDWNASETQTQHLRVDVRDVLTSVQSWETLAYPVVQSEICILAFLTECRGVADFVLSCIDEERGKLIYESRKWRVTFEPDPLLVRVVPFRIRSLRFPRQGVYRFDLAYNGKVIAEQSLRMR